MIPSKSKDHNPNYLATVIDVKESDFREHPNAHSLKIAEPIYGEPVITHINTAPQLHVLFPVESQIDEKLLSYLDAYRTQSKNRNPNTKGYFDDNGRVRAQKIRGEYSLGFMIPAKTLQNFAEEVLHVDLELYDGDKFDSIGEHVVLKKYEVNYNQGSANASSTTQKGVRETDRIIANQVRLHFDTEHFAREGKLFIKPDSPITITEKLHGTSFSVGNLLVKRKKNWFQKLVPFWNPKEYGTVYTSRRVVKNDSYQENGKAHWSGYDNYADYAAELENMLPAGFTVYGEAVGYYSTGKLIQPPYDYGCEKYEHKLFLYRVTFTNPQGEVRELVSSEAKKFCEIRGWNFVPVLFIGEAKNLVPMRREDKEESEEAVQPSKFKVLKDMDYNKPTVGELIGSAAHKYDGLQKWRNRFVEKLAEMFLEKDCQFHVGQDLPAEGICIRIEDKNGKNIFKMKSKRFLELETDQLDAEAKGQA